MRLAAGGCAIFWPHAKYVTDGVVINLLIFIKY